VHLGLANSFGLPSGKEFSCPGATSVCERICYAGKLEKIYKGVRGVLMHNWDALNGATLSEMVRLLDEMITEFSAECDKRGKDKKFRIHWDGDFFSADYANAWATVISVHKDVTFWVYTRSFNYVGYFDGLPNLAFYLSVDSDNIESAKATRKRYPFTRWAFLAQTMADGAQPVKSETGKIGAMCPENIGRIPLITGKEGACVSCGLCVDGKSDVRFAIGKK
jgi:hypothetical protein